MKTHRLARVAEAIRETAAETILFEMHDPRVKMVTVTRAEVSADLQHAKVFVSVMGTEKEQTLTLRGLQHAAGFIQSRLAKRLQTRFTPTLRFVLDRGVKNSIEMTRLINEALGPRPGAGEPSADEADEPSAGEPSADEPGTSEADQDEADQADHPATEASADGTAAEAPAES
jgi:ribosome-binding factor A